MDGEGAQAAERGTAAVPAAPLAAEASMPQPQPQTGLQTGAGSGGSRGSGISGSDSGNALLDTPPPAPCSRAEQNVLSPTPSPAAACPPAAATACTACPDGLPPAGTAAALSHAQAAGGRKGPLSPRAAELRRQVMELLRLHSFVRCLAGSAVLPSALLIIEVTKQHPPVALGSSSPAGLEWTVSQMLALFLRTGEKAADEVSLLAALWLLESAHNSRFTFATDVLSRYVKLIGIFFPEAARALCSNWPAAYQGMRAELVQAQAQLLARLNWRVHLTLETDVEPCHRLLFGEPAATPGQPADAGCAASGKACSHAAGAGKAGSRHAPDEGKAGSRPVRGLGGSKLGRPTLDDLEALLVSTRATLRSSVHSMATTLKEQAALLRRALLGQALKRGLCVPCAAEAKRRRTE